jgi:ATP-binding cassette subfamily C protein
VINRRSLRFFTHYLKAYPRASAVMIGLLVLSGVLEGVGILSLVPLLSVASGGADAGSTSRIGHAVTSTLNVVGLQPTIGSLVIMIVVSLSLKAVAMWLAMREVGFIIARVAKDLRLELIRGLLRAKWSYFGTQPVGHYANAISSETNAASAAYREACAVLAALLQISIYVTVSLLVSWQATLIAVVVGGGLFIVLRRFVQMSRTAGRDQVKVATRCAASSGTVD